jgi:two-component system LytT family sensor kinase
MPAMFTGRLDLLDVVGFLTGAVLFGLLLVMVMRPPDRADRFALATATLGLTWNVGELAACGLRSAGFLAIAAWLAAAAFVALGLLSAVVVHSIARPQAIDAVWRRRAGQMTALLVYACAGVAGLMHVGRVVQGGAPPSSAGLLLLTAGLVAAVGPLVIITRDQIDGRRALWMLALAVFVVSALHLGRFHATRESMGVEVIGHHGSLLLAFAILYRDYRFAFADIFLKQALALLALVAAIFSGYSMVAPSLARSGPPSATAVGVLLASWATTALTYPLLRRGAAAFVDRFILTRANYADLVPALGDELQRCQSPEAVLSSACRVLQRALSAASVAWRAKALDANATFAAGDVPIWTGEAPQYVLTIGPLAGGRRLLSDDAALLDRVAFLMARRIDGIRLTDERYERMLQERDMQTLATEAELRALRAQLNPHFLFNALTTVAYLIQHAPARALVTLQRLTALLRSGLRSEGAVTTLARERDLVTCYLEIERERFEERLRFSVDIPEALLALPLLSFVVQPLVENAVKHGIANSVAGGTIVVSACVDGGLVITVRNTGLPLDPRRSRGGGGAELKNLARRLRYHYGADSDLTLTSDTDGATIARLYVPLSAAEQRHLSHLATAANP